MSVRKPIVPFNSVTLLNPDLIGLAAWLCCDGASEYVRKTVLEHAAKHGNLDGLRGQFPFDSPNEHDWTLASAALAEGKRLVVVVEPVAPRPTPLVKTGMSAPRVPLNGYGRADAAGFNGQSSPDDIEF